ncbi:MAG: hypothetical protein K2U26_00730 [Cyclobacteriaceae bacterium]|nr:hypothetical protein [Cyclobacteriaceae bacterium]
MDVHKRVLGILFIVSGAVQILVYVLLSVFFSLLFGFLFEHGHLDDQWVLIWLVPLLRTIGIILVILFAIPSILAGWGLLTYKSWALTLALVLGCFKLFSFPIGTALGVYTIWVYSEEHRPPSK